MLVMLLITSLMMSAPVSGPCISPSKLIYIFYDFSKNRNNVTLCDVQEYQSEFQPMSEKIE